MRPNPTLDAKMRELGYVPAKVLSDATGVGKAGIGKAAKKGLIDSKRVGGRNYISITSFVQHWPVFADDVEGL